MVLEETLKHHFQALGVNVDDKEILEKCMDLCDLYNVTEEVLVTMWVAFMAEKDLQLEPTLHTLGQMERSVLKDKSILNVGNESKTCAPLIQSPPVGLQDADNEDILEMYGYKGQAPLETTLEVEETQQHVNKRLRSPDGAEDEASIARESKIRALESNFPAAGNSKNSATPRRSSVNFVSLDECIVEKCGRNIYEWMNVNKMQVRVGNVVQAPPAYMYGSLSNKVSTMHTACRKLGARLCSEWSKVTGENGPATTSNPLQQSQTIFRTWGRVRSKYENYFSAKTLKLESCIPPPNLQTAFVQLDVSRVDSYSIFPGQIVAVEGKNPTGKTLLARKIFTSSRLPPPPSNILLQENMHVVVAAGPFTDHEDLDYKPLVRFMENVARTEPHLLILIGPFVPVQPKALATLLITFQQLFEQIVEKIMRYTKGKCTQVVLIPSSQDAHHDPVYPTPEYFLPKSLQSPNLHLMPDPCTLDIEGLTIGTTSADIIRHLSKREISRNMVELDRISRMMNHVLSQGSFYPLFPVSKDINLDTGLWEKYATIHRRPHILIIPSDLQYVVKWLDDDCLVINPERINKGMHARFLVRPTFGRAWSQDNVDCQVVKFITN